MSNYKHGISASTNMNWHARMRSAVAAMKPLLLGRRAAYSGAAAGLEGRQVGRATSPMRRSRSATAARANQLLVWRRTGR